MLQEDIYIRDSSQVTTPNGRSLAGGPEGTSVP
jgi:hypothetical protein